MKLAAKEAIKNDARILKTLTLMKILQCLLKIIYLVGAGGTEQQICQLIKCARKILSRHIKKLIRKSN